MSNNKMPPLSPQEAAIIIHKGTEAHYSGEYTGLKLPGTYVCRACGLPLYSSAAKFDSGCGWPSFDEEFDGAVRREQDADGQRTEILCVNCGGHLGHVFAGEGFTAKNTRHCVNSISMRFIPEGQPLPDIDWQNAKAAPRTAIFAGGCFWGIEHAFSQLPGVLDAVSGYTGGNTQSPTYEQVCTGRTGHAEAVKVTYDPSVVDYETLAKLFFELHDPTEINRQGMDIGTQYRSALFYNTQEEKDTAQRLVEALKTSGYNVVTQLQPVSVFYPAESYHQDYIKKHPGRACHLRVKRFD